MTAQKKSVLTIFSFPPPTTAGKMRFWLTFPLFVSGFSFFCVAGAVEVRSSVALVMD